MNIGVYGNTPEASVGKWIPAGDANCDSTVTALDLFLIRNLIGKNFATADNWKADVNQDGLINVMDLIKLRNELGSKCN